MAKFHGSVGFGATVEQASGVFVENIVEHTFYGNVIQNRRNLQQDEILNKNLSLSNSISIVGNAYANEYYFAIKYVEWAGKRWTVTNVEVQFPRLLLQLGEVYNGPLPIDTP